MTLCTLVTNYMSAALVNTFTQPLTSSLPPIPAISSESIAKSQNPVERKNTLRSLLVGLSASPTRSKLEKCTNILACFDQEVQFSGSSKDGEEEALKRAVTLRLFVALYGDALETFLVQAMRSELEAEWWRDLERSRSSLLMYLIQTLPLRISNLVQTVLRALRVHQLPIRLSAFSPSSIRQLFPSPTAFQPDAVITALFPHLQHRSSALLLPCYHIKEANSLASSISGIILNYLRFAVSSISLPVELVRQECEYKRRELEKIRDQRAEMLGHLALLRNGLIRHLNAQPTDLQLLTTLLAETIFSDDSQSLDSETELSESEPLPILLGLSSSLATCRKAHEELLVNCNLRRPSAFVRFWPKLFLLPPLCIYTIRYAYASRATIVQVIRDVRETVVGFFRGWLVEPIKDVLRTVRTGGEDGIIVRREAVDADMNSLERMVLSLAKDELHYDSEMLQELSQKIKVGDLTPVLRIYEEDIKRPIKSALLGSLLRTVLVQVQKAKVDIDQTLTGIDRLLKSQELTFAFVGVAPAFAITYLVGGSIFSLYSGGRWRGKYGGVSKRAAVFTTMRRIERLLVSQPKTSPGSTSITPLTSGLLLLAIAYLRNYAETYLPPRSRIREGFLEDVLDLEDPNLGRQDKLHVIERMWRCWSPALGWNTATINT